MTSGSFEMNFVNVRALVLGDKVHPIMVANERLRFNSLYSKDKGMQGMCEQKQICIWEISKITVVDSNDVVNR